VSFDVYLIDAKLGATGQSLVFIDFGRAFMPEVPSARWIIRLVGAFATAILGPLEKEESALIHDISGVFVHALGENVVCFGFHLCLIINFQKYTKSHSSLMMAAICSTVGLGLSLLK